MLNVTTATARYIRFPGGVSGRATRRFMARFRPPSAVLLCLILIAGGLSGCTWPQLAAADQAIAPDIRRASALAVSGTDAAVAANPQRRR
jgi:hypothetical protein